MVSAAVEAAVYKWHGVELTDLNACLVRHKVADDGATTTKASKKALDQESKARVKRLVKMLPTTVDQATVRAGQCVDEATVCVGECVDQASGSCV